MQSHIDRFAKHWLCVAICIGTLTTEQNCSDGTERLNKPGIAERILMYERISCGCICLVVWFSDFSVRRYRRFAVLCCFEVATDRVLLLCALESVGLDHLSLEAFDHKRHSVLSLYSSDLPRSFAGGLPFVVASELSSGTAWTLSPPPSSLLFACSGKRRGLVRPLRRHGHRPGQHKPKNVSFICFSKWSAFLTMR